MSDTLRIMKIDILCEHCGRNNTIYLNRDIASGDRFRIECKECSHINICTVQWDPNDLYRNYTPSIHVVPAGVPTLKKIKLLKLTEEDMLMEA